jgi:CheY-like chemotaxis protein
MSRVLILDDHPDIIALLKTVLEHWGFEVISGRNGEEGLDLLTSSQQMDVIISNFRMPQMDGMTFLKEVRVHSEWDSIPFVMMSALSSEDYARAAAERGANAYLAKPFRVAELSSIFSNLHLKPN